jgi:hypothetical protein
MRTRGSVAALFAALVCLGVGPAGASAAAAAGQGANHHPKAKRLPIESIAVAGKAGPLGLRVGAGVNSTVTLKVNGKAVGHGFEFDGDRTQSIELRAADGLRAGANRLRLTAIRNGIVSRASRTVKVPGWALRADAGEDTESIVHTRTQVGTEAPPSAGAGGGVDYSWRLLSRPRGAGATLSDRDDAEPVLHAKEPGRYLLQETVDPEGGDQPTSYDQVTVSVVPDDPPLGVPINTLDGAGKIAIGGESFGGGDGISYVVLERSTRRPVASGTVPLSADGIASLATIADNYRGGEKEMRYLMIVSGRSGVPDDRAAAFAGFLKKIGTAVPSPEAFQSLHLGLPFSVIGIPGAPAGAATTMFPPRGDSGAITGYLTKNEAVDTSGAPVYDYNSGLQPTFDTKAPGSAGTTNKMTVNGQTYAATLPAGATAGFHLVAFDSLSLRPLANEALATNGPGLSNRQFQITLEKLQLTVTAPSGPVVLLQTIGKPKALGPQWGEVVDDLGRLGASPIAVNALDGNNEYALVGRIGAKVPPAESSTAADSGKWGRPTYPPAHLAGTLTRGRTSSFVPNVYGTATADAPEGGVNLEMMGLAYQAPTPWPDLATLSGGSAEEAAAAERYICTEMNFCQEKNSCPSVRECFWQRYGADWDAKFTKVATLQFVAGKGFNEATFLGVRGELAKEIEAVANVKTFLRELQRPFEASATESYVNLNQISDKIWRSLQREAPGETTSFVLGLIGKIASFGGIAQKTRGAAAAISAVFGLVSYLSKPDGQPLLGAEVKARTDTLATEMLSRITAAGKATEGIGKLYVSDYGKLMTAFKKVDSDWSLPSPTEAANTYRTASKQWFWEALVPAGYPYLIRANEANNARNLRCYFEDRDKWAWPNQPDEYQMNATVGYRSDGSPINAVFFFSRGLGGAMSPPGQIGDEMFKPLNQGGLGMEKYQFLTPRVFGQVYRAVNKTAACEVGFLPQGW